MEIVLQLTMDRQSIKGFTLIESIFVLSLIMFFTYMSIPVFRKPDLDLPFQSVMDVYYTQCKAIINKETTEYDEEITFNSFGNINHGTTITHSHYDLVFQLGCGRFYVRS